jgi:amidase
MIRILLLAALTATSLQTRGDAMTANDIRDSFIRGESAAGIAESALKKIEQTDDDYNAVIIAGGDGVNRETARLDALGAAERTELPLAGVPILVKDNVEVRDWPTTAGSLALAANDTGRDAELITHLREAGAVILGKANLSEWANFRSEQSISGWSGVGGQARNAQDSARSPCGSSSGSAVAVALGYVPVAIGSETDGSIVCPASVNGVVGFKPTHGIVSGEGVVPLAATQDTAGPIAISVRDAATTLGAMLPADHEQRKGLITLTVPKTLDGTRIGVLSNTQGFDARRDDLLAKNLKVLSSLGAELIHDVKAEPYPEFGGDEYQVLLYEFKHQLDAYLAMLPNELSELTLAKIIEFNKSSSVELSLFDQSIFDKALALEMTEAQYKETLAKIKKAAREDGLDKLLQDHELDVIVGITVGPSWMIDDINGDAFHGPSMSSLPAVGGHPHITVPMGDIKGMPVGLSFVGSRYADAEVAAIAAAFEEAR